MYVIKNTATNNYYRRLGNQVHQYVGIEDATVFRKWKQAKQKADILHAAISPIGEHWAIADEIFKKSYEEVEAK